MVCYSILRVFNLRGSEGGVVILGGGIEGSRALTTEGLFVALSVWGFGVWPVGFGVRACGLWEEG